MLYAVRAVVPTTGSRGLDTYDALGPVVLVDAPSSGAAMVRAAFEAADELGLSVARACAQPKPEHIAKGEPCALRAGHHGTEHDHRPARALGKPDPATAVNALRDLLTAYGWHAITAAVQELEAEHAARIAEHDHDAAGTEEQAREEAEAAARDAAEEHEAAQGPMGDEP